ncbi:MAG: TetR/AcrR family transcriptional regulator [Pseudomonadota bacterium]
MTIVTKPAPKTRRGDLRQALIDYALREAQAGHVETMSLRAAARDLGVSSGAVYRHFADKDDLLCAVVKIGNEHVRAFMFELRPRGAVAPDIQTGIARSFEMARFYIRYAHDNPTLWRMMFGRIGNAFRHESAKDPEWVSYTPMDAVTQNMEDLHAMGAMESPPTIQDIRFLWSAIHGAADLAQSGARLDGEYLDFVADDTNRRALRAVGCRASDIATWSLAPKPDVDALP